jgi:NAD(P)-dependent dehydrogenase (short-subunit alcohol dehydrogenase family)
MDALADKVIIVTGGSSGIGRATALARDRHGNLRCRLVFRCQFAEASTQSLLRRVRNRNHARRLALAPPCECHPNARPVLVTPRDFHEQAPDQRVPCTCDAARRCFSPLESSPGTSPRYAINAGAEANRRKSCNSARINIAVNVSMPRKQRSHPTGSRYGLVSAISPAGHPTPAIAPRCDRWLPDSRQRPSALRRVST